MVLPHWNEVLYKAILTSSKQIHKSKYKILGLEMNTYLVLNGDKLEIILDGGIRRGTHVLKALAAGAKACSFGKMFLFSLAAGGQQGVEHLLQNMYDEINRNMVLMGCKNLKELNSSKLIYRK